MISCLDEHIWEVLQRCFKTTYYVDIISFIYDHAEYKKHNVLLNDPINLECISANWYRWSGYI